MTTSSGARRSTCKLTFGINSGSFILSTSGGYGRGGSRYVFGVHRDFSCTGAAGMRLGGWRDVDSFGDAMTELFQSSENDDPQPQTMFWQPDSYRRCIFDKFAQELPLVISAGLNANPQLWSMNHILSSTIANN